MSQLIPVKNTADIDKDKLNKENPQYPFEYRSYLVLIIKLTHKITAGLLRLIAKNFPNRRQKKYIKLIFLEK